MKNNYHKNGITPNHKNNVIVKLSGFTLIELLVVVLIIGILAAIAVPQYQLAVDKAKIKSGFPQMRHIRDAEETYKMANGTYTTDFTELTVDFPGGRVTNNNHYMLVSAGTAEKAEAYTLSCEGTYCHVFWCPWGVGAGNPCVYWAFERDYWLCYPKGTARGQRLCKSLGCSNASGQYCNFKP